MEQMKQQEHQLRRNYAEIRVGIFLKQTKMPPGKLIMKMTGSDTDRLKIGMKIMEGDRHGCASLYGVTVRTIDRWIELSEKSNDKN